jgi:long-chain acyl-CoA synthetase
MGQLNNPISGMPWANHTFPQLMLHQASELGHRSAMREKRRGIWHAWSWAEVAEDTRALACGLKALGFIRGDRLVVIGDNRPRLYWAMCAAQMLGGVALPLAADTPVAALVETLQTHRVRFAVADGQEQSDKLIEASAAHDGLQHILFDNGRGRQAGANARLRPLDEVIVTGRQFDRSKPADLDREIAAGRGTDLALILAYPEITLGSPAHAWAVGQQASQSHAQGIVAARARLDTYGFGSKDEVLAYLPLGSWADQHFSFALALAGGITVSFPESVDTVPIDIRELGPTLHVMPAWAYGQLRALTLSRLQDANALHRKLFSFLVGEPGAAGTPSRPRGPLPWLGNLLIHAPLRDVLGLSRTKRLFVDGANTKPEALHFFQAIGLTLEQVGDWRQHAGQEFSPADSPMRVPTPSPLARTER